MRSGGYIILQLNELIEAIWSKAKQWVGGAAEIGRTHLQATTSTTVGQEWSGWTTQLRDARRRLEQALVAVHEAGRRRDRQASPGSLKFPLLGCRNPV